MRLKWCCVISFSIWGCLLYNNLIITFLTGLRTPRTNLLGWQWTTTRSLALGAELKTNLVSGGRRLSNGPGCLGCSGQQESPGTVFWYNASEDLGVLWLSEIPSFRQLSTIYISLLTHCNALNFVCCFTISYFSIALIHQGWAHPVSYTHLTLPTIVEWCRSRWSPYH